MHVAEPSTENFDTYPYKGRTNSEPQEATAYDNLRAPMCMMPLLTLRSLFSTAYCERRCLGTFTEESYFNQSAKNLIMSNLLLQCFS